MTETPPLPEADRPHPAGGTVVAGYFVPRTATVPGGDSLLPGHHDPGGGPEHAAPGAGGSDGVHDAHGEDDAHGEHDAHAGGMPFFPDFALREATAAFLYLMVLVLLAALTEPALEEVADPNASGYIPRPEWYFMFLFQLLKYFPGEMEVVGAFVIPSVAFGILIAIPFLDRRREPRTRRILPGTRAIRLLPRFGAAAVLAVIGTLTLKGIQAHVPITDKGTKLTAVEQAGADLYQKMGCPTCHTNDAEAEDEGGPPPRGKDLTHFARRPDAERRVLLHFAGIALPEGSEMPAYQLSPEELRSLSEYLMTFK